MGPGLPCLPVTSGNKNKIHRERCAYVRLAVSAVRKNSKRLHTHTHTQQGSGFSDLSLRGFVCSLSTGCESFVADLQSSTQKNLHEVCQDSHILLRTHIRGNQRAAFLVSGSSRETRGRLVLPLEPVSSFHRRHAWSKCGMWGMRKPAGPPQEW